MLIIIMWEIMFRITSQQIRISLNKWNSSQMVLQEKV